MWKSEYFHQEYEIVEYTSTTIPGGRKNKKEVFTGYPALRKDDQRPALVDLTRKPSDYPYDFVLL